MPAKRSTAWYGGLLVSLLTMLLAGCSGGAGEGGVQCDFFSASSAVFSGRVVYQDRDYSTTGFTGVRPIRPVRYAEVELLNDAGQSLPTAVVGRTDGAGNYCLISPRVPRGKVKVQVQSVAQLPEVGTLVPGKVQVVNEVGQQYRMDSAPVGASAGAVTAVPEILILQAELAHRDRVLLPVQGGAFNMLDNALHAYGFVRDQWHRALPNLVIRWQFHKQRSSGTFFLTRFLPPHPTDPDGNAADFINMKGLLLSDSNEYDDDVFLHEFGHFVSWNLAFESSPGGQHFINGANQDTRLAWSEGWANFFSAMVRDVNPENFSNRSSQPASFIDAFPGTEGVDQGTVRFAYELDRPRGLYSG